MSTLSLPLSPSGVARRSRRGSWLGRLVTALQEARLRSAREALARHSHLLPADFELVGNRLTPRTEDQIAFMRND